MKPSNNKIRAVAAIALIASIGLVGCGKTKRSDASVAATGTSLTTSAVSAPPGIGTPPAPVTTPPAATGQPPLSYEFIQLGSQTYTTPAITTDNVLKVSFTVGTTLDNATSTNNATWQASELAVTIAVNGREVSPSFTTNNYTYGRVGEVSAVVDFSQQLTPGLPVTITVKNPKYDFYCTYLANTCGVQVNSYANPGYYSCGGSYVFGDLVNVLANQYPGCRKPVFSTHRWSGKLLVQTSTTSAI